MNPGHVNLFVQMLMDSSKQFMNPGEKIAFMLVCHAPIIHQTSQKRSEKAGRFLSVKASTPRMRSNLLCNIQQPKRCAFECINGMSCPKLVVLWTNHGQHQQPQDKPSQEFTIMNRYSISTLQILVC